MKWFKLKLFKNENNPVIKIEFVAYERLLNLQQKWYFLFNAHQKK